VITVQGAPQKPVFQGTVILVTGTFTRPGSTDVFDPPDVLGTIAPPKGAPTSLAYSNNEIVRLGEGVYQFRLDTASESGEWRYEMAGTGEDAVVAVEVVRVLPRLSS
jgi:hypothetical protein